MSDFLIESPNGERIFASKKAFDVLYSSFGYKLVIDSQQQEIIQEQEIEQEVEVEVIQEKPKSRKRPKNNGGE